MLNHQDKPSPGPVAAAPMPAVQIPAIVQQKQSVEAESARNDGSDKYYGMENVLLFRLY
jgi:hypothetical protein